MQLDWHKIKNILKDNISTLIILGLAAAGGYLLYSLYQNFYLVISEKTPLEQIVIKEKINMDLYNQVKENAQAKKAKKIDWKKTEAVF